MKMHPFQLVITCFVFLAINAPATVLYVDLNSTNPVSPYADWSTAATNIQDAVDAAAPGDQILVTNGVYQTGGRPISLPQFGPIVTNRVVVTNQLTLESVNGPAVTFIVGNQVPGIINDYGAVRCIYLAGGAIVSGFTITNGATGPGGSDAMWESWGGGSYCPSGNGVVTNCIFINNSSGDAGGGADGGTFYNCQFIGNQSGYGGGVDEGTASNCMFELNSGYMGGGAEDSTLNNCTLTGNSASYGGGADSSTLNNCVLTGNFAAASGGGAYNSALNNCPVTGNSANYGGGTCYGTLNNCTLTGNSAANGGGVYDSTLHNCIVYFNSAPNGNNYLYQFFNIAADSPFTGGYVNYSCTTPLPDSGTGNISADPQLTDSAHLGSASPCRGAGSTDYVTGVDIDGEAWASPPSMGCDEYYSGATGPLSVFIHADYTNVAAGFPVNFTAQINGHASSSHWDFGDGIGVDNQPLFASHSWAAAGEYPVLLTAYNDSNPGGVSATVTVSVVIQPVHYVVLDNPNPVAPFTSWDTAATNIQDAVDAASVAGSLVLVTNGIYQSGGRVVYGSLSNRVVLNKILTVQSVNGPTVTSIQGYQVPETVNGDSAVRCVYMTNGAVLTGFTLTGGATRNDGDWDQEQCGGGVWCASASLIVSNCVIAGNSAGGGGGGGYGGALHNCVLITNSAAYGGGMYQGTLDNCLLLNNSAASNGGGTAGNTLNHCTLTGNSASYGGGASAATLNDCLLASNSVFYNGGGAASCFLTNCSLTSNSAYEGGGADSSTLQSCVLSNNMADLIGGGAEGGTLNNCTLTGNSAANAGGGADSSILNHCDLRGNRVGDISVAPSIKEPKQSGPTPKMVLGNFGGGAESSTLNYCTLMSNQVYGGELYAGAGGGADSSTLNNCTIADNSADFGGGVEESTLNNCTLTANSAGDNFGGADSSTLNNCIVYYNTNGDYFNSSLNYCCTAQPSDNGIGNITNEPAFVDLAGGDFHLQPNSPCINAGNNSFVTLTNDFDGNPRIQGGTVDIGAYEFQNPASVLSYAWAQQYGLPTDGTADYADTDDDGFNNWQEWQIGTSPTDPSSLLKLTAITNDVSGITVTWQSASGIAYFIQRSTNLLVRPAFQTIATDIAGQPGTTSYTDTDATNGGPYFYRVGVQ
jgi:hypothetical protein